MSDVLVDTSVWVDHFRHGNAGLVALLNRDAVITHPFVIEEIACGTPPAPRGQTLADLARLRSSQRATHAELLSFIEHRKLYGRGCGLVDLSLLAATTLTPGVRLWTLDKPLSALAQKLNVAWIQA